MNSIKDITQSARSLSRSPLGIIALFLILVYAVASLVITFGKPEFFQYPYHPVVIFLAAFPVIVLIVFAYLVSRHHEKLYAPYDYKNQDHFFRTLREPDAVSKKATPIATSDKNEVITSSDIQATIDKSYKRLNDFGFCLLHESEVIRQRTSPKSGHYRVRVWIEPIYQHQHELLKKIQSVTYRVWDDFPNTTLTTTNAETDFDLWLNIYGEFPLLALIKTTDGSTVELQRFIDLPGRPPD